ncbi:MAG: response regulator [Anaerolineae bacterium]|nr:response regulator [Anaerolineae bacterium]
MTSYTRRRVLVIDDDQELQELVQVLLSSIGVETVSAMSAAEGAEILRTPPLPDLVVLDLMLPDVSGLELLRQMRQVEAFDSLPVIILSALADPEQIRDGLKIGADRYITKPYISSNLTSVVLDVMRTGRRKSS